jgi:hypothetical protein
MTLDIEKVRVPAPGAYDVGSTRHKPVTMRGRPSDPVNTNPGPGHYELRGYKETGTNSSKYTMRGRPADPDNAYPAPGAYDTGKYKEIGSESPRFKYGNSPRLPDIKKAPGPGDYEVPPAFPMAPKY